MLGIDPSMVQVAERLYVAANGSPVVMEDAVLMLCLLFHVNNKHNILCTTHLAGSDESFSRVRNGSL